MRKVLSLSVVVLTLESHCFPDKSVKRPLYYIFKWCSPCSRISGPSFLGNLHCSTTEESIEKGRLTVPLLTFSGWSY